MIICINKNNEYLLTNPIGFFSLPDCISLYFTYVNATPWIQESYVIAAAAGLPESFVVDKKTSRFPRYTDLTSFYPSCPEPVTNVCEFTGYIFEIVQKFGGVYSENYYKYRIFDNLILNRPVIARIHTASDNWCLIIGQDEEHNLLLVKTADSIIWIDNWYDACEELVFFGKDPMRKYKRLTKRQYKDMYSTIKQHLTHNISMGHQAFEVWKSLITKMQSEQEIFDYSYFLLEQLKKNRNYMIQLIIYWKMENTIAGKACLRYLQLLINHINKIESITTVDLKEYRLAISFIRDLDKKIMIEWNRCLA